MIRVLIADDSATVRSWIRRVLEADGGFRVVDEAADGITAVERVKELEPDLVIMDVHMPGCDGLEATRRIMSRSPRPIIIISGVGDTEDVALSLRATEAGALMALPKPAAVGAPDGERFADELVTMARAMSQVKVVRRWDPQRQTAPARAPLGGAPAPPAIVDLVAVGASTGGPVAVREILGALPSDFPVPILVVQHIAHGFVAGYREWLDRGTDLEVVLADGLVRLRPGHVYVAPDDRHLVVHGPTLAGVSAGPPRGRFRPSVSALLESVAKAVGPRGVGVVLTGMGDDGVEGARALRRTGGYVLAQDQETSVVYGMAREAVRAGAVAEELALGRIAPRLLELVGAAAR